MKEKLELQVEQHKGMLVINGTEVCLLEGLHEDESDFYFVFVPFGKTKEKQYVSVLFGYIALKGFIPEKDYKQLEQLWEINKGLKD